MEIASNENSTFDGGPLGKITGVLDGFGLNFAADMLDDFKSYYQSFDMDVLAMDDELQKIFHLRPKSLSRYTELLQIGSKKPSDQYSNALKELLWDKLVTAFPMPTHNGVQIPGLGLGQSFREAFPDRGIFPVNRFLPLIAVSYGRASSFADLAAKTFLMDSLFVPSFASDLSNKILSVLKGKADLNGIFDRFSGVDSTTGKPWDPATKEIFLVSYIIVVNCCLCKPPLTFAH